MDFGQQSFRYYSGACIEKPAEIRLFGSEILYQVTLQPGNALDLRSTSPDSNGGIVYLEDPCLESTCLDFELVETIGNTNRTPWVRHTNAGAAPETVYFAVEGPYLSLFRGFFDLDVRVGPWACGDGFIDPSEACDDSNLNDGDGCSSTCQVESGFGCVGEPSSCGTTLSIQSQVNATIPDASGWGSLEDEIVVNANCVLLDASVEVNISHPHIGDLYVSLRDPSFYRLHNRSGGSANDIVGAYPDDLTPDDYSDFDDRFLGTQARGTWRLYVEDRVVNDVGTWNSWGLNLLCAQ